MNDRATPQSAMPAPFVSSVMRVEPGWIDYNGHLNMAYYNVLFDRAVDEVYELLGLGLDYVKTAKCSTFTAEVHVRYRRELVVDTPVQVSFRLLGFDISACIISKSCITPSKAGCRQRRRPWRSMST